jgi:GNAT superfamily N-acetyltransferase
VLRAEPRSDRDFGVPGMPNIRYYNRNGGIETVDVKINTTDIESAEIRLAEVEHLQPLAMLVDAYRVFAGEPSNRPAVSQFLFERLINHENYIYMAWDAVQQEALGFLQLYPGFCTLSLEPIWRVGGFFVQPKARRQGLGHRLMAEAKALVAQREDLGLLLETLPPQSQTEAWIDALGFKPDAEVGHYRWMSG